MRPIHATLFAAGLLLGLADSARADDPPITITAVRVLEIHDGDTFRAELTALPNLVATVGVRVLGENAPEISTTSACEKAAAVKARDYVSTWLHGHAITLQGVQEDKYGGRVEARVVRDDGRRLDADIIAAGLAAPYNGGTRELWPPCQTPPKPLPQGVP